MGTLQLLAQATIGGKMMNISATISEPTQAQAQTDFTTIKTAILAIDPAAVVTATYDSGATLT